MRNTLLLLALIITLPSCSLMERRTEAPDPTIGSSQGSEAQAQDPARNTDYLEKELSRLSAKVEALETKMEVLTNHMEKQQLHAAQPVSLAESAPTASPSPALGENIQSTTLQNTMSAVIRPSIGNSSALSQAEGEFKSAMELFQSGKNAEAGAAFVNFAHHNASHHLAPHALYWAGEANARAEQWQLASSSWEDLQRSYPRSAYLPEALAGLVHAYGALGEANKAEQSRAVLLQSFPQAPAALSLQTTSPAPAARPAKLTRSETANAVNTSETLVEDAVAPKVPDNIEAPFKEDSKPQSNNSTEEVD